MTDISDEEHLCRSRVSQQGPGVILGLPPSLLQKTRLRLSTAVPTLYLVCLKNKSIAVRSL